MATLTETAKVSRYAIPGVIGLLLTLMIGRVIVTAFVDWYKRTYPDIPKPTVGFGVIPPIVFPTTTQPKLSYKLETVSGKLPNLPDQLEVIAEPLKRPTFDAMDKAVKDAAALGFRGNPEKDSDFVYSWKTTSPIQTKVAFMIYDDRFQFSADWSANPNFLIDKNLPTSQAAIREGKDFIRKLGKQFTDLPDEKAKVSYLRGIGNNFSPALSLSDADFVKVDFYRSPFTKNEIPFVTPDPSKGIVEIIISGNPKLARIVRVAFNYFTLDYESVETYPLKTPEVAYDELLKGGGFVAQIDPGVSEVVVRKVELAYYDSYEPQKYIQPVFVFSGDHNFIAYVQAVKDPKDTSE